MKEKILAFMKTKLPGIQEAYLSGVADALSKTITDEAKIEEYFTDVTLALLKQSAQFFQVEGDRRATEATKTAVKTFIEKHGLTEDGKLKETQQNQNQNLNQIQNQTQNNDMPEWAKSFLAESKQIKDQLMKIEQEKTQSALLAKAKAKATEKGIPDWFFSVYSRNLTISEDKLDQLIATAESDYATSKQTMAEQGVVVSVPKQSIGGKTDEETTAEVVAKKRNTSATAGVEGKKI